MTMYFSKVGAVQPVVEFAFFNGNGLPYNLTGQTVTLRIRKSTESSSRVPAGTVTVDMPATLGTGYYTPGEGDVDESGLFLLEWVNNNGLTLPVGGPSGTYDFWFISPNLL